MKVVDFASWLVYAASVTGTVFALVPHDPTLIECFCIGVFSAACASALIKVVSK